jgi:hypothetical protein
MINPRSMYSTEKYTKILRNYNPQPKILQKNISNLPTNHWATGHDAATHASLSSFNTKVENFVILIYLGGGGRGRGRPGADRREAGAQWHLMSMCLQDEAEVSTVRVLKSWGPLGTGCASSDERWSPVAHLLRLHHLSRRKAGSGPS